MVRGGKDRRAGGFASLVFDTLEQGGTCSRFFLIHKVDIDDLSEYPLHVTGSHPHRQELSMLAGGVASERCRPFGGGELGCEIVRREDSDGAGGVLGGRIHVEDEVAACEEVPGLQQR